jgi:uncharacterized protein with HEPN domain
MPGRDPLILIDDILTAAHRADDYVTGLDFDGFLADQRTIDATVRNLEIIGEACRQLPDDFRNRHLDIPWRQISGLRNRIVHDYFNVDLEIVWDIVTVDLPQLVIEIAKLKDPGEG